MEEECEENITSPKALLRLKGFGYPGDEGRLQ